MTLKKRYYILLLFTTNYYLMLSIKKIRQQSQACAYIHLLTYISVGFEESHPDFPAGGVVKC